MKHKEITVGLSRTYSLPNYGNVRPSVSYTVELEDGDDPDTVIATMTAECDTYIRHEVDAQCEQVGLPAIYNLTEPRVSIYEWRSMGIALLFPSGVTSPIRFRALELPLDPIGEYKIHPHNQCRNYALRHLSHYATSHGLEFIDWSGLKSAQEVMTAMWNALEIRQAFALMTYGNVSAFIMPATVAIQSLEHGHDIDSEDLINTLEFYKSKEDAEAKAQQWRYRYYPETFAGLQDLLKCAYKIEREGTWDTLLQ